MKDFKPTKYHLINVCDGEQLADAGWTLEKAGCAPPSLVRTVYDKKQIDVGPADRGIYRFADWLPVRRMLRGSAAPMTYRSEGLARHLGLENLYITFSGWFPEHEARMTTCSFKETEAYSVCGRLPEDMDCVLVVASAGNTARAFAKVCSENRIPLLLSVPRDNLDALWFEAPLDPCVKLIAAEKGGDYFDAIHLSNLVLRSEKFIAEGGAKNVARRDGMGTTVLSAAHFLGRIPEYYFQAVGSGTGAIAAWEANLRLIADGRFGSTVMKLMVSQNRPFVPMYEAWQQDSRDMLPYADELARRHAEEIDAKVLSNRKPPYGIAGGMYDAVKASGGAVLAADNAAAREAAALFERSEGCDIHPAPAVALATLIEAVENKAIDPSATIMLNITGGGEARFKEGKKLFYLEPSIVFGLDPDPDEVVGKVEKLF